MTPHRPYLGPPRRLLVAALFAALLCGLGSPSAGAAEGAKAVDPDEARAELARRGVNFNPIAFFAAVAQDEAEVVTLFLQAGMDPATLDGTNKTALWVAVEEGRLGSLRALLAAGVRPTGANAPSEGLGKSIVFAAVDTGNVEFVRALLEAGADAKAVNDYGVAPLDEAARVGQIEMCKLLLAAGANPNNAASGYPMLYGPINENQVEAVRLLLDAGAKLGGQKVELLEAAKSPEMRALLEAAE